MRKALVVGVDFYDGGGNLYGCVNDAHSVKSILERHADGSVNFHCKLLTATGQTERLTRRELKDAVEELFKGDDEIALLFFAGHGYIEATGGYLCASDTKDGDDGLSLNDVLLYASKSKAKNRIIMLDSCHSGYAGGRAIAPVSAELTEGLTILTASTEDQYATEKNGSGLFTTLLVDALSGAAANLVGYVTPGSVYAHIDQSLGPWQQRPVFKTNVTSFVSLRSVQPPISLAELQKLNKFFPEAGYQFKLDPSYEPERNGSEPPGTPSPDAKNTAVFAILQNYVKVNLLVPVDAPHMWHAAMNSKSCKLTALGEHYRRLVQEGLI